MIASDIPQTYPTPTAMARTLSSFIDDAYKVRRLVLDNFQSAPCVKDIRQMRRQHLASLVPEPVNYSPSDAHRPADEQAKAKLVNDDFLRALEHERNLSALRARQQGALDSPSLRQPEYVNRAWDRETERAWLANGELGPCE